MHWQLLTYFGDSMLLLPSAIVLAFALLYNTSRLAPVFYWLVSFGTAGLVVSISKVLFLGFLIGSARYNFTGFSGHTTMSTTFWPIFFWFIARGFSFKRPLLWVALGYLFALTIAYSRLVLHAHSPSEVICGFLLGCCCSLFFLAMQRKVAFKPVNLIELLLIVALPLFLVFQGKPATTQHFLGTLAAKLAGMEQPHTRQQLLSLGR